MADLTPDEARQTWQCPSCGRTCSLAFLDCVACGAKRLFVACCVQCEQPQWPQRAPGGGAEVEHDWPACVNPECEAYGDPVASVTWRRVQ